MEFLRLLETIRTPFFNRFFTGITYLGEEMLVVVVLCTIYWCLNKKLAYRIGFVYFVSGLLVQTLKITFQIPRPWILDPAFQPVASAVNGATGYSFPSGHSQCAAALYGTLALYFYRRKKKLPAAVFVVLFLLVGFSRMYLGVHTPKDVLVSFLLTLLTLFIMDKVLPLIEEETLHDRKVAIAMILICLLIIGYAYYFTRIGYLDGHYAGDCIKAAAAGLGFSLSFYLERRFIRFEPKTSFFSQPIKLLAGVLIALTLKSATARTGSFQYTILILWIMAVYPYFIKKIFHN